MATKQKAPAKKRASKSAKTAPAAPVPESIDTTSRVTVTDGAVTRPSR